MANTTDNDDADGADKDKVSLQYIYGPIAAQTIAAQTVELQIRCRESTGANNLFLALGIRVVSSDGLTVRGTILAVTRDATEITESSTFQNRRLTALTTAVTASAGDYIVIELGAGGNPSFRHQHYLRIGDADASDLPEDDTDTTDKNPWIEFPSLSATAQPSITTVAPDEFVTTDTGIVIAGVNFEAAQGTGNVELGDSSVYASATKVSQTETAWGDTSITFTAVQGALSAGTVYVFVTTNGGLVSAGFAVELGSAAAVVAVVLHHAQMSDRTIMAAGGTANRSLARNFSSSDPTPLYLTYTPSSVILGLYVTNIATLAERLFVLRTGASIQILSAVTVQTPTVDATMHANLAECFWMWRTNINSSIPGAGTIGFQAGTSVYTLSTTAGTGDAPTAVQTNWQGGGQCLGVADVGDGRGERVWTVRPRNDLAVSYLHGQGDPAELVSLNLEFTDPDPLAIPLGFVGAAMLWNGGIIYTDYHTDVWFHQGVHDVLAVHERDLEEETEQMTVSFGTLDGELLRLVAEFSTSTGLVSREWLEVYSDGSWAGLTGPMAVSASAQTTPIRCTKGLPVTQPSMANRPMRTVYWFDNADFYHASLPPPGENHWNTARNTGDGNSGMVFNYTDTGFAETPTYFLGASMVVADVELYGDLRGTDSTLKVEFASMSATGTSFTGGLAHTFQQRDRIDAQSYEWPNNSDKVDRLKMKVTLGRGTDSTRESPNALPLKVGLFLLLDGKTRTPSEIDPDKYGAKP